MSRSKRYLSVFAVALSLLAVAMVATAEAKSLYMIANHHTRQFDAWNINPDGTASGQTAYNLTYACDPAGVAIDESSATLFVTTEFSYCLSSVTVGVEYVDATTMTSLGYADVGVDDLAGIAVDDVNDIVYAVERWTDNLYAFDWDPVATTLTLKAGYPKDLPGCSGAFGIALDETTGILWVADSAADLNNDGVADGVVRAYNVGTWTEDTSKSFTPSHAAVDVAVDRERGLVYTVSLTAAAHTPWGTGSTLLSKWDGSTETTVDLGDQGVGVAVDEVSGYVYVTVSGYGGSSPYYGELQVWDTSTSPFTQKQTTGVGGSPAGICVPQEEVGYNPLGLTKDDDVADDDCVTPGDSITYTICYSNTTDPVLKNYEVHNVTITDDLPAETSYTSASGGGTYNSGTHTVTWNIGDLTAMDPGDCVTLVVEVGSTASPGGTIINPATIDSDETPPTTVNEETEVCPCVEGASVSAKLKCHSLSACITPPEDYVLEDIVAARIVSVDGVDCVVEGELVTDRRRCRTTDCATVKFDASDVADCLDVPYGRCMGKALVGKQICVEAELADDNVTCPVCTTLEKCSMRGMR